MRKDDLAPEKMWAPPPTPLLLPSSPSALRQDHTIPGSCPRRARKDNLVWILPRPVVLARGWRLRFPSRELQLAQQVAQSTRPTQFALSLALPPDTRSMTSHVPPAGPARSASSCTPICRPPQFQLHRQQPRRNLSSPC